MTTPYIVRFKQLVYCPILDNIVPKVTPQACNNATFNVDDEDSLSEEEKVFSKCDWCQIVDCNFPQLKPLKCTVDGCNNLVHHLCQIEFERSSEFPETLPLATADRRALMFAPVRSSSPSLADLNRPSPRASTRLTRGRSSADFSSSSTSAFSSARSSGLLSASLLASKPQGDCEWYSSLASLRAALPSLPVDRTDPTGVASLAPAARGCEFPLLEFLSQALFSAIFSAILALVGPSLLRPSGAPFR